MFSDLTPYVTESQGVTSRGTLTGIAYYFIHYFFNRQKKKKIRLTDPISSDNLTDKFEFETLT